MKESKLVELYQTLEDTEKKQFREYLSSALFNTDQNMNKLYSFLLTAKPNNLSRVNAFQYLFPNKEYKDLRIRQLMSKLLGQMESFLAFIESQKKEVDKSRHLLAVFRRKGLQKHYKSTLREVEKLQKKSIHLSSNYLYNQFQVEQEKTSFQFVQDRQSVAPNLVRTMASLDEYYLLNKLKYCCEIMNYMNIVAVEEELPLMKEIIDHIKISNYEGNPAIQVYSSILMTLIDFDNELHFYRLKKLLTRHTAKFPNDEARSLHVFAQNYCIKRINSGDGKYLSEIFALFKIGLEEKTPYEDGYLTPWTFKNIVTTALRLKEFDWASDFIQNYHTDLRHGERENALIYNQARLHFYKKEYRPVIKLLQQVEYNDVFYGLDSRTILLKTYYELDEIEPLLSLIESFKVFLRRNKLVSDHNQLIYKNFVKFLLKLVRVQSGNSASAKLKSLRKEINEVKKVADVDWLIEKMEA